MLNTPLRGPPAGVRRCVRTREPWGVDAQIGFSKARDFPIDKGRAQPTRQVAPRPSAEAERP